MLVMISGVNIIDIGIIAVMAFFLIRALFRGFIREILGLVGIVAAVFLSANYYDFLGRHLESLSGIQADWWYAVAFGALLLIVLIIFTYLGSGLSRIIQQGPLSGLDRLLGAALGAVKGILVSYLLLNLLLLFTFTREVQSVRGSYLAPPIVQAGRFIVDLVPDDILNKLQKQAGLIKDATIDRALRENRKPEPPAK